MKYTTGTIKHGVTSATCALILALFSSPAFAARFVHPTMNFSFEYPDSWSVDQALLEI